MPRDLSAVYFDVVYRMVDKLSEGIYDIVSSFGICTELEMTVKLAKFNLLKETLIDILPEDFDKSDFSLINQHFHFVDYFSTKKNFSMLKQNADNLLKQDIPTLKKNLKLFWQNEPTKVKTTSGSTENYVSQVIGDIRKYLRRQLHERPQNEKDVQDRLEDLLALRNHEFDREQVGIPFSTKSYKPDFTSDRLSMAIDVKFCNSPTDEKEIIDQINADILGYKQKYQYILFVVYDMAIIRNLEEYISDIEKSKPGVTVIIIKH